MKTAGLYARISTTEGKQHLATQLQALRRYASRMAWKITGVYTDEITGASVTRPGLDQLLTAAARHDFDTVLVFELSRLTRRGPASAFELIERLRRSKVELWSMTEEHFRTPGAAGELLIAIAAFLARQERETMQARVKAGLDRARANGTPLGRRRILVDKSKIQKLRESGASIRAIANELKYSKGVIERAVAEIYLKKDAEK
jgi:DNA invertase Pin-like site-specific DNA recombinase